MNLEAIIWNVNPSVVPSWNMPRWYGILFALGFYLGIQALNYIAKKENFSLKEVESIVIHTLLGTIIGARLGHCLFYDPIEYLSNPLSILKIWEGGLASHGGIIGILTGIYIYSRKKGKKSFLWVMDRMALGIAIGCCFIRIGNLMNSEIIGKPTESDYGFIFTRATNNGIVNSDKNNTIDNISFLNHHDKDNEKLNVKIVVDFNENTYKSEKEVELAVKKIFIPTIERYSHVNSPHILLSKEKIYDIDIEDKHYKATILATGIERYPSQLFESLSYLLSALLVFLLWKTKRKKLGNGFLLGSAASLMFFLRFINEYFKENQELFEEGLPYNMGQLLSVPFIIWGIWLMVRTQKNTNKSN